KIKLDDLFNTILAEDHRNTKITILNAVLTFKLHTNRENTALISYDGFHHLRSSRTRSVPRGSSHQFHKLTAANFCSFENSVEFVAVDKFGNRNPGNGGISRKRYHSVTVTTKQHRLDIFRRHVQRFSKERTVTRRVKNTSHTHHTRAGQTRRNVSLICHHIKRV